MRIYVYVNAYVYVCVYILKVDLDDEINKHPIPKLEEGEFIDIIIVDLKDLLSILQGFYWFYYLSLIS